MIDLYTWTTPNGRKASVALEEMELEYKVHPIRIGEGDQHTPEFRAVNPNGKIPAIIDRDAGDFAVFESGAILIYLAEKTGRFLPADARGRSTVLQWLMFQMGGLGPMQGQAGHFVNAAPEKIGYAIKRYQDETRRLYEVMDKRLADVPYLAGDYSIADMATYPWVAARGFAQTSIEGLDHVTRWADAIAARPAVERGMQVPQV